MSARLLSVAAALMSAANAVSADIFVLGDVTPVFSLTDQYPHHGPGPPYTVEGNQDLFLRLAGDVPQPRVLIRAGETFTWDYAISELHNFYDSRGIRVDDTSTLASDALADTDLLILISPDWPWEVRELAPVTQLVARGGHVLLMVEPGLCKTACRESNSMFLGALGTTLRIGDKSTHGAPWGLLADHPFMQGIRPVTYGAALTIRGGTQLMYDGDGLSVFSVDELGPSRRVPEIGRPLPPGILEK